MTGPAGIQADIGQVFDGANMRLLLATAGVVALLLIITYRSPVLWLVPLAVVGIADRLAAILATNVLEVTGVAWDESTIGILSVLVFGAGTDYALLLISRYRDELKTHDSRHLAMARALARTAEAVCSSAVTVVLGLLTLLLSAIPTTRGLGLACAVGIVVAATFALVVLPAALVLFGRWVFWPRVPHVGDVVLVDSDTSLWHRVGSAVAARPRTFVVGTLAALAVLASGTLFITTGLDPADQFLEKPEAIAAAERLGESFPAGTSDPIQVVTRDDPQAVVAAVEAIDGVTSASVTAEGDGVAQVDIVTDVRARQRRHPRDRGRRPHRRRRLDRHPRRWRRRRGDRRARLRRPGPPADPAADPAARARRAAHPAALGGRAAAARRHGRRDVRRQHGRVVVALPHRLRLRRDGHRRAAAGVPLPGRARRRLQHLPGHPRPRGGARARHPARGCCAR